MKVYRAAIAGCGRIGSLFSKDPLRKGIVTHAAAYLNDKNAVLAAACDPDEKRLRDFGGAWHVKSLYKDVKKMLECENIDILSICTPPATHYKVLNEALEFPIKAIFCEKPLADNVRDAQKMADLCREKGVILQVGHQRRFDQLHISLRKFIADKKAGDVQQVNFYYTAGIKNTGSHMFDILRFFFGDVEWVEAFHSNNSSNSQDLNLDGILKFKNGIFATFQACDAKKYLVFEMSCFLDKARIILKDSGFSLDMYGAKPSRNFSGYNELSKTRPPFTTKYKRNFLASSIKHLIGCLKSGKDPISCGYDGLAAMKIIDAVIYSAKNKGRRVWID